MALEEVYFELLDSVNIARENQRPVLTDMKMWGNVYEKMPFIASVAWDLLPIQPTQTAAERIFNRTKCFNVGRESTKPERVEKYRMSGLL